MPDKDEKDEKRYPAAAGEKPVKKLAKKGATTGKKGAAKPANKTTRKSG